MLELLHCEEGTAQAEYETSFIIICEMTKIFSPWDVRHMCTISLYSPSVTEC